MREDFRSFRADRVVSWKTLTERLPRSRPALLQEWREREGIPAQLPD
jgi:predicted DNA-binding transcriptional regulator YafY